MDEPAAPFRPGQCVFHLSLAAGRATPHRLSFGRILWARGERACIRPIEGGRARVVRVALLAHAGHCPACDEPAHARAYAPVCPRCRQPAAPTPPPDAFVAAHFPPGRQLWPRVIARLVRAGLLDPTDAELGQALRDAQAPDRPGARVGSRRAA